MQLKAECNFSYRFLYNLVPNQYSKSSTHFLLCECRRRLKRFLLYFLPKRLAIYALTGDTNVEYAS